MPRLHSIPLRVRGHFCLACLVLITAPLLAWALTGLRQPVFAQATVPQAAVPEAAVPEDRVPEDTALQNAATVDLAQQNVAQLGQTQRQPPAGAAGQAVSTEPAGRLSILFLGDQGHHRPSERFRQIEPVLKNRGIDLTYTESMADISTDRLSQFDGLAIYANITEISPEQEQALVGFVEQGKGLIALHCASYCFLNSEAYVKLVGAQFSRHDTGVFRTVDANPSHALNVGFEQFESWDETYEHHRHNEQNRTVLAYREGNGQREPWTWVRTQGKGRVFYTAWGHDYRTWSHEGFQRLVERGARWAVGQDAAEFPAYDDRPAMTAPRTDVAPFEYQPAKIAFYPPGGASAGDGSWNQMQLPLSPEESIKHYVVPQGFRLELFAAEPEITKPICMNWDAQGRLWIAETIDYPNDKQPQGKGHDRIRIVEDTDGDGRADKFTTFADKLSIPTSFVFYKDGIILHQAPDTLFLRDTDQDGQADKQEVLFTGWSVDDTHAGPSNLRWGLDNWIWGQVGYAGFNGEIAGRQQSFRMGFYRFRPDGSEFEFLRNTNNNSWGVGLTEEGLLFGSTANGNPSVFMPIANRYYESVRGWSSSVLSSIAISNRFEPITEKVRQVDWHHGFTAAAGHAIYTGDTFPAEYKNRVAFVCEPTGHLVACFVLEPYGANFVARNAWNLVASDDEWSAPIVAEVGPDGHVWIIDWYNYIVQHNPTPAGFENGKGNAYVTDLRDKTHGRIYRLVYEGANPAAAPPVDLEHATVNVLLSYLNHDNMFWRLTAQRLLAERGDQPIDLPRRIAATESPTPATPAPERAAQFNDMGSIHALWLLKEWNRFETQPKDAWAALARALTSPSQGVRLNALRVLPKDQAGLSLLLKNSQLFSAEPQVRLQALLALSELPASEETAALAMAQLTEEAVYADAPLADAATMAAANSAQSFLELTLTVGSPSAGELRAIPIVAEHWARSRPDADQVQSLLVRLAESTGPAADAVVTAVERGWPENHQLALPSETDELVLTTFERLSPAAQGTWVGLAKRWGSQALATHLTEVAGRLLEAVADAGAPIDQRIAAAQSVIALAGDQPETFPALLDQINPQAAPELVDGIFGALAASESSNWVSGVLERFATYSPSMRKPAVRAMLAKASSTEALLAAANAGEFSLMDMALDQRQTLLRHPNEQIRRQATELISKLGGNIDSDRAKIVEEWLPVSQAEGVPAQGKLVFAKHCNKCHVHSGEGTRIGPDLTGMAVHPKAELLTQILDPSRSVEGNFRGYTVVTNGGLIFQGLLLSETRTSLEIADAEGKKHQLQREDIAELSATGKSFMPEGFEKQVTKEELTDLLAFLTVKGKFVPIPLAGAATITSTRGMFYDENADVERLIFPDWEPKTFSGVPFYLVDPQDGSLPNVIMLNGPIGKFPPQMPRSVRLPCNMAAKAIHLLGGVSGWGFPSSEKGSLTMTVRLEYADGQMEEHPLLNGQHFADYIRRVDVPGSQFAFALRGQQIRYLSILPKRDGVITGIELIKGDDQTAPVVMAITVETK